LTTSVHYGFPFFVLRMRQRERWQAVYDQVYTAIYDAGAITSPLAEMIIANNWPAKRKGSNDEQRGSNAGSRARSWL
jgi:hypothetical protein